MSKSKKIDNQKMDEFLEWNLNNKNVGDSHQMQSLNTNSNINCDKNDRLKREENQIKYENNIESEVKMSSSVSMLQTNDTKSLTQTNDNVSQQSISQTQETNFRSNFDYVLKNITKSRNNKKLEIIDIEEINVNKLLKADNQSQDFSQIMEIYNQNELSLDDNQLKLRAQQDILNTFTAHQIKQIMVSLENVDSVKDLSFEQIRCLILSFSDTLRLISSDSTIVSFYRNIFEKYGFPGIAANIQTNLFDKWQQIYIVGCLSGLFEDKVGEKKNIFGILFPETLVRIVMRTNKLSYSQALALINPPQTY